MKKNGETSESKIPPLGVRGLLTIIKIGGNVVDNPTLRENFLNDFAQIPSPKILVHGGGKIATQVAVKMDVETVMVEGRRITDKAMLDVVTMVYGGLVNKTLVEIGRAHV